MSHIPAVYDGFLTHPVLHDYVEHPLYLVSAMIYFQPLLVPFHRYPPRAAPGSVWSRCSR